MEWVVNWGRYEPNSSYPTLQEVMRPPPRDYPDGNLVSEIPDEEEWVYFTVYSSLPRMPFTLLRHLLSLFLTYI